MSELFLQKSNPKKKWNFPTIQTVIGLIALAFILLTMRRRFLPSRWIPHSMSKSS